MVVITLVGTNVSTAEEGILDGGYFSVAICVESPNLVG